MATKTAPVQKLTDAERQARTALFAAIDANDAESVGKILTFCPKLAGTSKTASGSFPLHAAVDKSAVECVRLIIEAGPNVDEFWLNSGQTPLMLAATRWSSGCAQLLLDNGANAALLAHNGETPLHCAARNCYRYGKKDIDIFACLIAGGVDASLKDWRGATAYDTIKLFGRGSVPGYQIVATVLSDEEIRIRTAKAREEILTGIEIGKSREDDGVSIPLPGAPTRRLVDVF